MSPLSRYPRPVMSHSTRHTPHKPILPTSPQTPIETTALTQILVRQYKFSTDCLEDLRDAPSIATEQRLDQERQHGRSQSKWPQRRFLNGPDGRLGLDYVPSIIVLTQEARHARHEWRILSLKATSWLRSDAEP
ncbi:MAG: hypothetical protein AMXMBFR67_10000 [Nitrospira sp.]